MPGVVVNKVPCPMDPHQAALLLASMRDFRGTFEKMKKEAEAKGQQVNPTLVISQMVTMRKAATCPEILNTDFEKGIYKGVAGGGKLVHIDRIARDKIASDGKVVILSDFIQMQKTVEEKLKDLGVIRFNTAWNEDQREEAFDAFQTDPSKRVFIAGTKAVREGVDLSAADICICCDLLWSPAFQTQAWSRIMAPQTRERTCEVYLMLSANSLDEHIYNVFYSKMIAAEQALDRKVMNRRAVQVDIRWFVERVLEEERAIASYMRDVGFDHMIVDAIDLSVYEERSA
jgi:SNF2 family DNA or RNA helicase